MNDAKDFDPPAFRRKLWRLGVTECSEGYRVWMTGRYDETHYEEDGRSATMGSQMLLSPTGKEIWRASLRRWDPPHELEPLTDADRERIPARVRAAGEWAGMRIVID